MKCFLFPGAGRAATSSAAAARLISRDGAASDPEVQRGPPEGLRAFTLAEMRAATRGFSRALVIGEGGFGCVYRGVVKAEGAPVEVAVKQMSRSGLQGHKEWITEVNILGVVKHPNLVKLVGYCAADDERGIQRLLVYEFMPNKSLEDHLLARVPSKLSWSLRLKIACDAARGLAYLHEEMDFQVVGTVGYAAPEYVQTGRLTAKSDVWSFGVVLYELITGRRTIDRNLPRNEQNLLEWVRPYATDSKKLHKIIDPRLEGEYCKKSVRKLVSLANKCLIKRSKLRPKMSQVVETLDEIIGMSSGTSTEGSSLDTSFTNDSVETTEIRKERSAYKSRVFDFREVITLRNRSVRKLERLLAPVSVGKLARTWGYD